MKSMIRKLLMSLVCILSLTHVSLVMSGDVKKGEKKAELCSGCHGAKGISVSSMIPNLAGQKEEYLANSIKAYKSGARKNGLMASVVTAISDDDINDLAAYFASLKCVR